MKMRIALLRTFKNVLYHSRLRPYLSFFNPNYFNFRPPQLCFLCECLEKTRDVEGAVVEVGVAFGSTTWFQAKYMIEQGIEKPYYAIDTFAGFTSADIEFEVQKRGKTPEMYTGFQVNSKKWFDGMLKMNHLTHVKSIQADANEFDFSQLGPISFCLLDVDLYRPISRCLPKLYDQLSEGGIIVVDDCDADVPAWEGSGQAYNEFMTSIASDPVVVHKKLGVVERPHS